MFFTLFLIRHYFNAFEGHLTQECITFYLHIYLFIPCEGHVKLQDMVV